MNQPKFKVGQVVLYQNSDRYELGVVKKVITSDKAPMYFVYYHMVATAVLTDEYLLKPIINSHLFLIVRRSINESIDLNPMKQLAQKITSSLVVFDYLGSIYKTLENYCEDQTK